jgi:hypothetical protein
MNDCTHQGRRRAPLAAGLAWSDPCMLELSGGGGADADGRYARSDAPLQEVPDPITNANIPTHATARGRGLPNHGPGSPGNSGGGVLREGAGPDQWWMASIGRVAKLTPSRRQLQNVRAASLLLSLEALVAASLEPPSTVSVPSKSIDTINDDIPHHAPKDESLPVGNQNGLCTLVILISCLLDQGEVVFW